MPRNEFKAGDFREEDPALEEEALSQEVVPVEDDPHQWPTATLAELRKTPGFTTTAEHFNSKDEPLQGL